MGVTAGSITSSIGCSDAGEGIAITAKIKLGVIVHTISITFPWTIFKKLFLLEWGGVTVLGEICGTEIRIIDEKDIVSWCKSTIPSIIGEAGSWKPDCQSCAKSQEEEKDAFAPQIDLRPFGNRTGMEMIDILY